MSAQRSEQRRENRDHDVHDLLDRPLRTFLHSITPPFCNYLSFLLILTKTLKTPLCVCGLRPLCFSREPASESELSSRSQDNHRFVPNHRPPSAKTPFAPLTEKQPVRRLTPRLPVRRLPHRLLSAGSPLDSCPQAHPSTPVRRLTLCLPVRRLFLSEALFFPLWRSEFRRNRGWLVRRARACSQARTDVAYTEVVDLRPPSAVFFLFLSTRQFTSPLHPQAPTV